jgi:type II secretory pathway pseudopilin PulG
VELATQAAKSYIDGIATGAITAPSVVVPLAASASRKVANDPDKYLITITNMPAPTEQNGLYCFNKDGSISNPNCTSNSFYIQAAQIKVTGSQPNDGYRIGIRVYRADVDFSKTLTASTGDTKKTQQTFTGGVGDRQAPLIEMTTDIGSSTTTFEALCKRLGVASETTCN